MKARVCAGNHGAALLAAVALSACATSCSKRNDAPVPSPVPAQPRPVTGPVVRQAPPAAAPAPPPAFPPAPPPAQATMKRVRSIVAYNLALPVSAVPVEAPLSALSKPVDELAVVEIVLALEEAFRIEIPDDDLEAATGGAAPGDVAHISVRTLAEIVERRASKRGGARK